MKYMYKTWSRDWENYDWEQVMKNLHEFESGKRDNGDLGISREELLEYYNWLEIHDPAAYGQLQLVALLTTMGLPEELVAYYKENPEQLKKDIDGLKRED